jgi:hypothetical protein
MRMLLLVLLVGCAHAIPHVAMRGDEVLAHVDELAANSQATFATVRVGQGAEKFEAAETVFLDQSVTINGAPTTLANALEGCGAFVAAHPCRIDARTRIVLREVSEELLAEEKAEAHAHAGDSEPHTPAYNPTVSHISGVMALGALAGMGLCIAYCHDDVEPKSVGLAVGALVLLTVWAVTSGAHD